MYSVCIQYNIVSQEKPWQQRLYYMQCFTDPLTGTKQKIYFVYTVTRGHTGEYNDKPKQMCPLP